MAICAYSRFDHRWPRLARWLLLAAFGVLLGACASAPRTAAPAADAALNPLAERYVQLALALDTHDRGYVDAYFGPPEWRVAAAQATLSLPAIYSRARSLAAELRAVSVDRDDARAAARRRYLAAQLDAMLTRTEQLQGRVFDFDDEAQRLFGVRPPRYREADFKSALAELDKLLPGEGPLAVRYAAQMERFSPPPEQIESLMRRALDEARQRTAAHFPLPERERIELHFVTARPWAAYNWYQGQDRSRVEINREFPVHARAMLSLAAHEGYPGHHVYYLQRERLLHERGWAEYGIVVLPSPQSVIAEGSAELAAILAFPGSDYTRFARTLLPQTEHTDAERKRYERASALAYRLRGVPIEVARRYLDGALSREEALRWLQDYALLSPPRAEQRLQFIERYRSYIVTYVHGEQLVRAWLLRPLKTRYSDGARWQRYVVLLSEPYTPADLLAED